MIDFLDFNDRHLAALIWTCVLGSLLAFWAPFRTAARGIVTVLATGGSVTAVSAGLFIYVSVCTAFIWFVVRLIGFWESPPVIAALIWYASAGLPLLGSIGEFLKESGTYYKRIKGLFAPAAFISAIFSTAILPFAWELFLFPIVNLLSAALQFSRAKGQGLGGSSFVGGSIAIYAVVLFLASFFRFINDLTFAWEFLQAWILPVALTAGTFPFMRTLVQFERWRFVHSCRNVGISATEFGFDWPLSVESAKLCCKNSAVWVRVGRDFYGLNGFASPYLSKFGIKCRDIQEIWKHEPHGRRLYLRKNLGPLIQAGLALEKSEEPSWWRFWA